jgi:hypothetical protein
MGRNGGRSSIAVRAMTRRPRTEAPRTAREPARCCHCGTVVRYDQFVIRYDVAGDRLLTPRGLVIQLHRRAHDRE